MTFSGLQFGFAKIMIKTGISNTPKENENLNLEKFNATQCQILKL